MNKFGTHMKQNQNESNAEFEVGYKDGDTSIISMDDKTAMKLKSKSTITKLKNLTTMAKLKGESLMGEEPSEGNAFGAAMQKADKGDKVKVGDQEFIKKEMHTNDMGENNFVDHEGRHAKMQLQKAAEYSIKLTQMMDDMTQLPSWVQSKITKASDYMSAVYHYLDYEMSNSQNSLMENMDKHRKRSTLMEGAMKRFFKAFDSGSTDEELVYEYAKEGLTVPEAFVSKARKQWESLKKAKLDLELSEKEAKGSSGTAFFINNRGHLLTNNHVVNGCTLSKISYKNKDYDTKLIATDKTLDLALLKAELKPKTFINFSKDEAKKLNTIYVAGYPLGKGLSDDLKISSGIVSSLKGFEDNSNEIQIDAPINSGNSGGPIINEKGDLIAIAVSGMAKDQTEGINFGIKSSAAERFLKSNNINIDKSLYSRSKNKEQLLNILEEGTVYTYCN